MADLVSRLLAATCAGALVGLNRELTRKPAGLRTHALVALGSALFSIVALGLASAATTFDPAPVSRVMQGIIAGIGFVGGGVILHRTAPSAVYGLTTAASIWVVAGAGAAAGLGLWRTSFISVLITLLVLIVGHWLDIRLHHGREDEVD